MPNLKPGYLLAAEQTAPDVNSGAIHQTLQWGSMWIFEKITYMDEVFLKNLLWYPEI